MKRSEVLFRVDDFIGSMVASGNHADSSAGNSPAGKMDLHNEWEEDSEG